MTLKTIIFSISTIGVVLGALDYFGYAAAVEERIDRVREKLGELVRRAGIFKPVIVVANCFLPESATSPAAKVSNLVMMSLSAPIFALVILFLYGLLKIAEISGFVENAENILGVLIIAVFSFVQILLAPLQALMSESAFSGIITLLAMIIISALGYVVVSVTIILLFVLLNMVHIALEWLNRPEKGTVATFGFGIGIIGYALGFFVEC